MSKYLVSFPSSAMDHLAPSELQQAGLDSHRVVAEAKASGVWVFGGGIDGSVPAVLVDRDGDVTPGTYPETARIEGGYAVLDVDTREEALRWAARIADACRCAQEVRVFGDDPES
jgi:hypothetical protein